MHTYTNMHRWRRTEEVGGSRGNWHWTPTGAEPIAVDDDDDTNMHACIYTYIHTYTHTYTHIHIHTYTYIHAYIYAHTYRHIGLHMHTYKYVQGGAKKTGLVTFGFGN